MTEPPGCLDLPCLPSAPRIGRSSSALVRGLARLAAGLRLPKPEFVGLVRFELLAGTSNFVDLARWTPGPLAALTGSFRAEICSCSRAISCEREGRSFQRLSFLLANRKSGQPYILCSS